MSYHWSSPVLLQVWHHGTYSNIIIFSHSSQPPLNYFFPSTWIIVQQPFFYLCPEYRVWKMGRNIPLRPKLSRIKSFSITLPEQMSDKINSNYPQQASVAPRAGLENRVLLDPIQSMNEILLLLVWVQKQCYPSWALWALWECLVRRLATWGSC